MLSGPLVSGTRTYYLITCLHMLVQFYYSLAIALLLFVMFLCCHTLVVVCVIHCGAFTCVVATLGLVTTR